MTVREIVVGYLRVHGFDGLCSSEEECSCTLDDLMPCGGELCEDCLPAYKIPADPKTTDSGFDYVLSIKKGGNHENTKAGGI